MEVRFLAFACLLGACGGAGSGGDGVTAIELGTGETTFTPIGDEIELTMGPQGGWHLWLTLRLWSEAPNGTTVDYTVRRASDGSALSMPTRYVVDEERLIREGDHWLRLGDRAILAITSADMAVGEDVEIDATAGGLDDAASARIVDALP